MGYTTAMWLSFGEALAAIAGALTGLLFAAVSGTALLILDRRAGHGADQGVARYFERFSPNAITAVLVGVAGATLLARAGGGLYWLIPAAVASLVGGVVNAWLFLIKVARPTPS